MPGVPDFYQGTECWDLSLVDPDNRRAVDFKKRAALLTSHDKPDWAALARHWPSGDIKFAWTRQLLKLRSEMADVFTQGDYEPLDVSGPHRDHVIAFARRRGRKAAIVVVGRWFAPMTQNGRMWPSADQYQGELLAKGYVVRNTAGRILAHEAIPLSMLFRHFPAAALSATAKRQRAAASKRAA